MGVGGSDMTSVFEEQVAGERQMYDLRRNLADDIEESRL